MSDVLELLAEKVSGEPFGLFYTTGEGRFFPNGDEETSGCLVTRSGRHYSFWTGWDDKRGDVMLIKWKRIEPVASWLEDDEYRDALAIAATTTEGEGDGLAATVR